MELDLIQTALIVDFAEDNLQQFLESIGFLQPLVSGNVMVSASEREQ